MICVSLIYKYVKLPGKDRILKIFTGLYTCLNVIGIASLKCGIFQLVISININI